MRKARVLGLFTLSAMASAIATASDNYIELGAGYLSDDAGEVRQYTGNTEEGTVPLANFGLSTTTESGIELTAEGENLGLDSRSGSVEVKRQGDYEVRLEANSIPHLKSADAVSRYAGAGDNDRLVNDGNLHGFDLETRRDRVGLSAEMRLNSNWKVSTDFSKEKKEGTELYGANLPVPVDYETDIIKAGLHYVEKDAPYSFNLGYAFSSFENGTQTVSYDEDGSGEFSNIYLAPDNYAHMLTLNGVYRLSQTGRVSLTGRKSYMRQDEDFGTSAGEHRNSAEASVDQSYLNLAYTDRFSSKTNVRARYTYKSRDNDTPVEVMDNHLNLPFSTESHKFDLEGGYRLSSSTRLSLAYAYEDYFRNDDYLEVEDTETNSLEGKMTYRQGMFNGGLSMQYKERRGDDYVAGAAKDLEDEESTNSPYNRRYFLADLDESRVSLDGNYQFTDRLHVGGEISYFDQEYLGGEAGLKNSTGADLLLDATYMLSEDINLFTYASGSQGTGDQVIYLEDNDLGNPLFGSVDAEDTVYTFGFGGQWESASMPLSVTVDYSYSDARSEYDMFDPTNAEGATNPEDLTTRIHYFSVEAEYEINDRMEVTGLYSFERAEIADFYMTDMSQVEDYTYFDDPDYKNHFIGVAVKYYLK